jgi:DNA polymerase-3 subunit delta
VIRLANSEQQESQITEAGAVILKSIQEDIKNGDFKQAYLFFGEETYLKQQYKGNLVKALNPDGDTMNFSRYEGKGIDIRALIDLCETMPFFAERRVVLLEDTGFFKNKCDELADYMKEIPDYLCMIFVESEVDKRSRMYKAVKNCGRIVEFARQDEKTLMRWAAGLLGKEGKKITQRDMELLLTKTGTDMGNLRMELEKLITYTGDRDVVTGEDIETVCTTQTTNKIFDMVRAVTEKNQKRALELYYDLLTLKEPPMRILFLLARQFRQLLLTKKMTEEGASQMEISSRLGVPTFAVRNIASCARSYTVAELEQAVADFVDAEEAVKTGRLEDVLSVELLIVKYSSAR